MKKKETLSQLIIRDIATESCGEIDLRDYEDTIQGAINHFFGVLFSTKD